MYYKDLYIDDVPLYYQHNNILIYQLHIAIICGCSADSLLQFRIPVQTLCADFNLAADDLISLLSMFAKLRYLRYQIQADQVTIQYNSKLHALQKITSAA